MTDKFEEVKKHFDRNDKTIANLDKLIRKLTERMKKREVEHSQLAHAFQSANTIVKHLVLQNHLLQLRTGGVFNDDELKTGQEKLQAQYNERQKLIKEGQLQSQQSGAIISGRPLGKPLVLRDASLRVHRGGEAGQNGDKGNSEG